jgi:hypothetical protein
MVNYQDDRPDQQEPGYRGVQMKSLYIHDQKEGALVLYGHDLDDQMVEALVAEFQAQGKYAFAVDQASFHGGPPEICEKCRQAGEKIAGGTSMSYRYSNEEESATSLNGEIGMVSTEINAPPGLLSRLGKPLRMLFSIVPYLAALALIAYGLVYFLRSEAGQSGGDFNFPLAAAQRTPTQTLAPPTSAPTLAPAATFTPPPSPTVLPAVSEPTLVPTEVPPTQAEPACVDALSITPADAGQTLCITGVVYRAENINDVFMITFSKDWGNFYLLSYNREWKEAQAGVCIQVTGEIEMLGTIPVIAFGYQNDLLLCP